MEINSIFITQEEIKGSNLSGRITITNIMETIPKESIEKRLDDWEKSFNTEWRWRFLKFPNGKIIVEISFVKKDVLKRIYFNKKGVWVERNIDPIFDQFVIKEFYYYCN